VAIDELVRAIAFYTFRLLNSIHTRCIALFPAVFTLWHSEVYVCAMNCSDEAASIESPIDETLGFGATLCIPYIDLDNGHVWLGRYLDDSWFRDQDCYDWHLLDTAWIWAKGNDDMIGCTICSSVSTLWSRYTILASSSCSMTCFLMYSSYYWPHELYIVSPLTSIYSIDTILYPYTLPLESYLFNFSQVFALVQPEL